MRMSTEHQQYSTHNQADKIREYAEKRGIEIVRTYADDGVNAALNFSFWGEYVRRLQTARAGSPSADGRHFSG